MPFTNQQIIDAGKIGIDLFMRNNPIDQVGTERPFLKKLMAKKKVFPGAKQFVTEQLRYRYQSNFQFYRMDGVVTYNKRQSVEQAYYPWYSAHDGLAIEEDRFKQNGIVVVEDDNGTTKSKPTTATKAELIQLTSLFEEQSEILRLGFEQNFSQSLLLDGSAGADNIVGLDTLVSLTPAAAGTVGGIDQAANTWWRNYVATGLTTTTTTGTIIDKMEEGWRACTRATGGRKPDFIMAGSTFIDGFRNFLLKTYGRVNYNNVQERVIEGGTSDLYFHGVPVVWNPEFADLDTLYAPATPWEKRCYFVNTNSILLRPMEGQDMVTRRPPRVYNKYEFYWALTWSGSLTCNQRNANAVFALA